MDEKTREQFSKRITELINFIKENKDNSIPAFTNFEYEKIVSGAKNLLNQLLGRSSEYYNAIEKILTDEISSLDTSKDTVERIYGLLHTVKDELNAGYMDNLSELVHSDIFSNYFEMAEELLAKSYKDAAAVIIGTSLEVHLKNLSNKNSIPIETKNSKGNLIKKSANIINLDLKKAEVYNEIMKKQIDTWQGIRNSAAHGDYQDYSIEQVQSMKEGVLKFILEYPA